MKNCNCCTTYNAPDLMDGGVAAALIEQEVAGSYTRTGDDGLTLLMVQQQRDQATARAAKAEQERDEARKRVAEYVSLLAAPLARPLTADDITDAEQYQEALRQAGIGKADHLDHVTVWLMGSEWARKRLNPRPEGAEDVAVRPFQAGAAVGVEMTEEQRDALADHLAAMHVRVVGEEQS